MSKKVLVILSGCGVYVARHLQTGREALVFDVRTASLRGQGRGPRGRGFELRPEILDARGERTALAVQVLQSLAGPIGRGRRGPEVARAFRRVGQRRVALHFCLREAPGTFRGATDKFVDILSPIYR